MSMIQHRFAVLAASTILLSSVAFSVAANTTRVRFQTYVGTEFDEVADQFKEYVKEKSDGSLQIQYFHGGEMIESDQFVEGVSRGTVDVAYGVGSYWPGTVDIGNIEAGLPGAWVDLEEARDIFENQGLGDLISSAYEEAGVKFVGRGYGSNYDLLSKKPVNSLDDMRDMKIRASSQVAKVLAEVGVSTIFLPVQEVYIGMSTGIIDGVIYGGPTDYEQLKLNETAEHYTFLNLLMPGWTETAIANPAFWDGLSDENREILSTGIDLYAEGIHKKLTEGDKVLIEANEIFTFSELPAEDSATLTKAAQVIWAEEAKRSERTKQAIEILINNAREKGRLE